MSHQDQTLIEPPLQLPQLKPNQTGVVPIYKPIGPSSHDMIYRLRRYTGIKKIGHAGTLDPLAEGVLIVGITRQGTKQLGKFLKQDKQYQAEFTLGQVSQTDDRQGPFTKVEVKPGGQPSFEQIRECLDKFVGTIWQRPPRYSAVKIAGQPAYKLARQGVTPKLKPRLRQINSIEIISYLYPKLELQITTGSGVYIRSLARDLGKKLKTGGYMSQLIRTRVSRYQLSDCFRIPRL